MDIVIDPGGSRVDAHFGQFRIKTDQPAKDGGSGSAPTPFDTFLASIGACAGIYVLGFCRQRGLPTDNIRLTQRMEVDSTTGLTSKILLDIHLPPGFPEKYRAAVIRAAEQCKVKKHFEHPPIFEIKTRVGETNPT